MPRTTTAPPPASAPAPLPADLHEALRRLKLATVRRLAPEVLQTAKVQRWAPEEVLRTLIEAEVAARDESNLRARLRGAGFPVTKTLDEFKVAASSVPQSTFDYLSSLEWVTKAENLCLVGPAGTGKSHLLVALGHAAVAAGHKIHGFAWVTAKPSRGQWFVTAVDEGPYPDDVAGHRSINAVAHAAGVLAREYGGYLVGVMRRDPGVSDPLVEPGPIVRTNPGGRPAVPVVRMTAAPSFTVLPLTPDAPAGAPVDLSDLDDIPWAQLDHANGPADDIPDLIRALAEDNDDWADVYEEVIGEDLLHQRTCYSATPPAMPFLARLAAASATLSAKHRYDLYVWLVIAANRPAYTPTGPPPSVNRRCRRPGRRRSTPSSATRFPRCWPDGRSNPPRYGSSSPRSPRSSRTTDAPLRRTSPPWPTSTTAPNPAPSCTSRSRSSTPTTPEQSSWPATSSPGTRKSTPPSSTPSASHRHCEPGVSSPS